MLFPMTPPLTAAARQAALLLLLCGLVLPAAAGTITYDIQAYIDGRSLLIFSGYTLQWHNLSFTVPGKHDGHNDPTIIIASANSSTVTAYWYPYWPDGETGDQYSYENTSLNPPFHGYAYTGITLTAVQARGSLTIYQMPGAGNNYTLILDFDDEAVGGSAWYRGIVTVGTFDPEAIPEPGTFFLTGAGALLVFLYRRLNR